MDKVKIYKSKWYLTKRMWPTINIRWVFPQYGAFETMSKALDITYQPVADKDDPRWQHGSSPMERKPGFEGCIPVKGERILKHPDLFLVPLDIVYIK